MIRDCYCIIFSYLNWVSDKKYTTLIDDKNFLIKFWKKYTLFESLKNTWACCGVAHCVNGVMHSEEDKPAYENSNGTKIWYKNGKIHRLGKPAVEEANGDKYWYKNGNKHRDNDQPAVEIFGKKEWWIHGKLIRIQGVNVLLTGRNF